MERSRVVQITDPERNFHCFYQLCASGKVRIPTITISLDHLLCEFTIWVWLLYAWLAFSYEFDGVWFNFLRTLLNLISNDAHSSLCNLELYKFLITSYWFDLYAPIIISFYYNGGLQFLWYLSWGSGVSWNVYKSFYLLYSAIHNGNQFIVVFC